MASEKIITRQMCQIIKRLKRTIRANERLISHIRRKFRLQSDYIRSCSMQNEKYAANSRYALSVHKIKTHTMSSAIACTTTHFPHYPYEIY